MSNCNQLIYQQYILKLSYRLDWTDLPAEDPVPRSRGAWRGRHVRLLLGWTGSFLLPELPHVFRRSRGDGGTVEGLGGEGAHGDGVTDHGIQAAVGEGIRHGLKCSACQANYIEWID